MNALKRLVGRFKLQRKPRLLPCVIAIHKDDVRLELVEYPLICGHSGYRADLEYHIREIDEWVPIASIRDFNLDAAMYLLGQAQKAIKNLESC